MRPDSQIYMLLKNLARKLLMLPQERTQFGAAVFEHGILQMFVVLALVPASMRSSTPHQSAATT